MAKVSFTKLGLVKNQEIKTLNWQDQNIEIKQYLPIIEILDIVESVVNHSHDSNNNFANPLKIEVYTIVEIMFHYTNINFTDKQKEDVLKLYDLIVGSGLYEKVVELIPIAELNRLKDSIYKTVKSVYDYQNSVLGILESVATDYSNLDLDATNIQKILADPNNMTFLKDVITKLG